MKRFRSVFCQTGRFLLASMLIPSVFAKSTVGEALLLHQHSGLRAHVHVLGYGGLRSYDAPSFSHSGQPTPGFPFASERVRTFAIVTTGAVFVSELRPTGSEAPGVDFSHHYPSFSVATSLEAPAVALQAFLRPAWVGRTASAVILLRNHTLLI